MKFSRYRMLSLATTLAALALGAAVSLAQGYGGSDRNQGYGGSDRNQGYSTSDRGNSSDRDMEQQVLSEMHSVNQMEIRMGEMAMRKGQSREVREFGRRLRRDHQMSDRQVLSVARREHIDLTMNTSSNRDDRMHQELESASGHDFDRAFMKHMAEGHADVLRDLTQARHTLRNGRVRALVTSTIPAIRRHQRMAQNLESRV